MNALRDRRLAVAGDSQELDPVAELDGEADVECADVANALNMHGGKIHRAAEDDAGENRELVGGVDPVDVGGGIGLCVAKLLRLLQHGVEIARLASLYRLVHRRHDVVAGAVQDAVDAADPIACEALAQRLDDGDAARDRGLVTEVAVRLPGGVCERRTVMGEQGLVGGHQVLAVDEGGLGECPRDPLRAANQLDHDIDGGVGGKCPGVVAPVETVKRDPTILVPVARRDRDRLDRPARALLQQRGVVAQQRKHAAADRTQPGNADS